MRSTDDKLSVDALVSSHRHHHRRVARHQLAACGALDNRPFSQHQPTRWRLYLPMLILSMVIKLNLAAPRRSLRRSGTCTHGVLASSSPSSSLPRQRRLKFQQGAQRAAATVTSCQQRVVSLSANGSHIRTLTSIVTLVFKQNYRCPATATVAAQTEYTRARKEVLSTRSIAIAPFHYVTCSLIIHCSRIPPSQG